MKSTLAPAHQGPKIGSRVRAVTSEILDIPTIREHKLSNLAVTSQSIVIVRVYTEDGVMGIGEAATLGGPLWSEESVETIKAIIDGYLSSAVAGLDVSDLRLARQKMSLAAQRNNAAKGALETALLDAYAKTLGLPAHRLLGGAVRSSVPVLWALASGDPGQETEEALEMVAQGRHRNFKVKIGAKAPEEDIARIQQIARGIEGKGRLLVVDANQAWDEATADFWISALEELGLGLLEQPLPSWNLEGMARLAARHTLPLLADESVFSTHDAFVVGRARAADAVSLKVVKNGGPIGILDVASVASSAGLALYGGCLLESAVGTAAQLHAYSCVPELHWGSELFGPLIQREDIAETPLIYRDFEVALPDGPGLGISLDEEKVTRFRREGEGHA